MNAHRDPDRLIHAFLSEGQTELVDPVYDAVRAGIERKRQRVVIDPWRTPLMNKFVAVGLGTAAVVLALVVGARFLEPPGSSGVGGVPTAAPTATPAPVATPAPTPVVTATPSAEAELPEGPHRLSAGTGGGVPMTVTIATPSWFGEPGAGYVIRSSDDAGMMGFADTEYYVYGDGCHYLTTKPVTPSTTVDQVIDAMAKQKSREASAPEDITVDGHVGKKIILHMAAGLDITTCDEGGDSLTLFGSATDGRGRYSQADRQIEEVWAVDVDGRLVVLDGLYYPDTPQPVVDEVRALLASTTFE